MEKAGKEFLDLTGLTSVWSRIKYLVTNIVGLSLTNYATKSELDSEASLRAAVGTALTNHIADTTAHITAAERSSWNAKTSNVGTITGITMNGASKGTSGVVDLGTVITAHQDISGKSDKSATVSTVAYDTTNKKITKTINGSTTDVVTASTIVTDGGGLTSSEASNTYVKKSGDTMNGVLKVKAKDAYVLEINSSYVGSESGIQISKEDVVRGYFLYNKNYGISLNNESSATWLGLKDDGTLLTNAPFVSSVATGTAPLSITSTTKVDNLNADMVDGYNADQLFRRFDRNESNNRDFDFNSLGDLNNMNGVFPINTSKTNASTGINYGGLLNLSMDELSAQISINSVGLMKYRYRWWSGNGNDWGNWREIAFTDSTVANATNADMIDGLHSNALVVANSKQTILSVTGNGQYGYVKIATFTITKAWSNFPAIFEVFGRGITHTILTVIPANESTTYPSNVYLYSNNSNRFYIRKSATSTWELYCQYTELQGTVCVRQLFGNYNMSVTLDGTNVSSLPSDCVQASAIGMSETANKLSSPRTLWGQSFDGTKDIDGTISIGSVNESEALRINLINTESPNSRSIGFLSNVTEIERGALITASSGSDWWNSTNLIFSTNSTSKSGIKERMRLTGDGKLGIGTTEPTEKLEVAGNIKTSGHLISTLTTTTDISKVPTTSQMCVVNTSTSGTFGLASTMTAGTELQVIINNTSSSDITIAIPTTFKSNGLDSISIESGNYGEINVISDGTNLYLKAI